MLPIRHWKKDDWHRVGFGVGIEPFRWRRFGFVDFGGNSRWFNIGPIFIQWSIPRQW